MTTTNTARITIATGTKYDPVGLGGWAFTRTGHGNIATDEGYGNIDHASIEQLDLTGIIEALSPLTACHYIDVESTSRIITNGLMNWRHAWRKNAWAWRNDGSKIPNRELWMQLDALCAHHSISARWVDRRENHAGLARCAYLAEQSTLVRPCRSPVPWQTAQAQPLPPEPVQQRRQRCRGVDPATLTGHGAGPVPIPSGDGYWTWAKIFVIPHGPWQSLAAKNGEIPW